jgi:hypothetical protein
MVSNGNIKSKTKNIFDWVNEITYLKSPINSFSNEDWEQNFNSYMIHKWLSMNLDYIDIVNYVQKINPQNKQQIYSIYREMIPKKKLWLKYIKNTNKKNPKELAEYISKYFQCSLGEADHYIDILRDEGITEILQNMGVDSKEIKSLIKKSNLK